MTLFMFADASTTSNLSLVITIVVGAWLFFLGGCVGSFLNVVAYRLPRGMTLIWRPSKCPLCEAHIRPWHNLPVLGWLLLRGRCRDCRAPISIRYPLIEALVGSLLLALGVVELFGGGANLPIVRSSWPRGAAELVTELPWDLMAIYVYHGWLLCVLVAAALIRCDGHRVPKGLVVIGLVGGLVPALFAVLHPLPWQGVAADLPEPSFGWGSARAGIETALLGLAAGGLLGLPFWRPRATGREAGCSDGSFALALVGLQLGWQTVVLVGVLAVFLSLILGRLPGLGQWRQRWPLVASVLVASFFVLLTWHQWNERVLEPLVVPAALAAGYLLLVPLAVRLGWLTSTPPGGQRAATPPNREPKER